MARFEVDFFSYILQRTVSLSVIIPSADVSEAIQGKEIQHTQNEKYPVIYLLHGYGGNHTDWLRYTSAERYADERKIALVCIANENKLYLNHAGDNWFEFITREVPDFVTGMFPISKRPEDTYMCGYSNGGYGTLVFVLNEPEKYRAFGCFSGTHSPLSTTLRYGKIQIIHVNDATAEYFPSALIHKHIEDGTKLPPAYIACGGKDSFYEKNKAFAKELKDAGSKVVFDDIMDLGHEWRFWDTELERFMDWLPRTDAYAGSHQKHTYYEK